ncbi:MAG: beta-ketoacyl-ACP synthase II [Phycisphaerales bacterium]|jgi:3-oxoacyl-[acyl-carrier-protein] synthase II|nr:beta-ketoacyl-ACP synthase II [Phycisphaerales bacterium]
MTPHRRKLAEPNRVVVTGMGALTNLARNAPETWSAMREGRSGISPIEGEDFARFDDKWLVRIGGQIKGWDPTSVLEHRESKRIDRCTQLALAAAIEAAKDSGLDFASGEFERRGVVIGSGIGGITTIEEQHQVMMERGPDRMSPFTVPRLMANAAAGNISIKFNLRGPASTHATACASSGHAFGDAINYLRWGHADVMMCGGAEAAVSPLCLGAFMVMKALSQRNDAPTKASRPFDRMRDGFVLAEGAAMFVLETEAHAKARGARIYAELVGAANSSDAAHITAPDPEGSGAARSMLWALEDSGLNPTDIEYVNAHGTSTPLGDKAEVAAALRVFGDHARKSAGGRLMMSSTKSMHGHGLGASGAIELIACIGAVSQGVVPPTINLEEPDEGFDIDLVPNEARERPVKYAMNNTFGFGGHNVTLIVGRYAG